MVGNWDMNGYMMACTLAASQVTLMAHLSIVPGMKLLKEGGCKWVTAKYAIIYIAIINCFCVV